MSWSQTSQLLASFEIHIMTLDLEYKCTCTCFRNPEGTKTLSFGQSVRFPQILLRLKMDIAEKCPLIPNSVGKVTGE